MRLSDDPLTGSLEIQVHGNVPRRGGLSLLVKLGGVATKLDDDTVRLDFASTLTSTGTGMMDAEPARGRYRDAYNRLRRDGRKWPDPGELERVRVEGVVRDGVLAAVLRLDQGPPSFEYRDGSMVLGCAGEGLRL